MIRAGSVGIKSTCEYVYWDEDGTAEDVMGDDDWDEKGRTMISHIYVTFEDEVIKTIQFGYLENGAVVLSEKHGFSEGSNFRAVRLIQDEYVAGLSGVLGKDGEGIRNLTFHTNLGEHGPIGSSSNKYPSGYEIKIDPAIWDRREFGGFFGSYSRYKMSSIGIYVIPNGMSNKKPEFKLLTGA